MKLANMCLALLAFSTASVAQTAADGLSRGIGIYPGSPLETFAPTLSTDNTYRNVALNRAAMHSSSADYNLTAQLLTDGIVTSEKPSELIVSTNSGSLQRREKEWTIDGGQYSRGIITGEKAWLDYLWKQSKVSASRITITCTVAYNENASQDGGAIRVLMADGDKKLAETSRWTWNTLPGRESEYKLHSDPNKQTEKGSLPAREVEATIDLGAVKDFSHLRLCFDMPGAAYWNVTEVKFWRGDEAVTDFLPSNSFHSVWASDGDGEQWVSIDLGAECNFDELRIYWVEAAKEGQIEVSNDGTTWQKLTALHGKNKPCDVYKATTTARFVRVLMTKAANSRRYAISEIEVMGRGGVVAVPHYECQVDGNRWSLSGGNWRLQRASEVKQSGEELSKSGIDDSRWIIATVPSTVLMSYVNVGSLPNPNYANNLFYISESYFNADFWYRKVFDMPASLHGEHIFLNLDGINWKADIYLNGRKIDRVEGAFMRGRVDITPYLQPKDNVMAIRIYHNAHPGAIKEKNEDTTDMNGGLLGADNPTFHATIGWDWISTIRGRDIGIWNDAWLSAESAVSLRDATVETHLIYNEADTLASMKPSVVLTNNEQHAVSGTLRGWIGSIQFQQEVSLGAGETKQVDFLPETTPTLSQQKMQLWWPNGYGEPYLYDAGYSFTVEGQSEATLSYKAGIREVTFSDPTSKLRLYVNGVRITPMGGNWGFSENNLCYRAREYDIAIRYHRDMNFNMIRNWVGQIGDDEFYQSCDRYGIMVWQDFWLANPADGPDPYDEPMFMRNAADYVSRIRNHPSVVLYCGRNEGYPPASIDKALRTLLSQLHPCLPYISSSADDGVSGHGPYWALPRKEYFERQSGLLHSERGLPNIMTWEGTRRTLRPSAWWPQNNEWGQHDFTQHGAQRGASFNEIVARGYGQASSAEEFCQLAQWENFEGYRAMFESSNTQRMGLVMWMSHPCWPSMVWQTYDYYFEPTSAFFACKKACEAVHAQYNSLTSKIQVVNLLPKQQTVSLKADLYRLDGSLISSDVMTIQVESDTTVDCFDVPQRQDYSGTAILRLTLNDGTASPTTNDYLLSATGEEAYPDLQQMAKATVETTAVRSGDSISITMHNHSGVPAMLLRLNLKATDGEQILPVDYSDNYFHLMPDEEKQISISWNALDARGLAPTIELSGYNVDAENIEIEK